MDSDQLIALLVTDLFFFIKVAQTDEKKNTITSQKKRTQYLNRKFTKQLIRLVINITNNFLDTLR